MENSLGLYVHIPFCRAKCGYCDFNSYTLLEHLIPEYVRSLTGEIKARAEAISTGRPHAATIYFGGGTPSLLQPDHIASILEACRSSFQVDPEAEITLEANPGTVDLTLLQTLVSAGINRLSLGVQSFDDTELRLLDRIHSADEAAEAFVLARSARLDNINLDLIYGLPGQPLPGWHKNLKRALALQPDHLSLYALTLEEDTPLGRDVAAGRVAAPDSDLAADMYLDAEETLQLAGYQHYEISNWARPGKACRHNLNYWKNQSYLGFGAGAHSCHGSWRFWNVSSPANYIQTMAAGSALDCPAWMGSAVEGNELITGELERSESVILGLRLVEGVDLREFAKRFKVALDSLYAPQLEEMTAAGLLESANGRIRLTQRGRLLGNEVFQRFLPAIRG